MGSAISRSLPSSLWDSDSDTTNQIEVEGNSNTLIRTTPIVDNHSFTINATKNKNQHKKEGITNSNKCSICGSSNARNMNGCPSCIQVQQTSSIKNTNDKVWCWKDNNASYIQYPISISNELNKLKIGAKYTIKIENTKYEIKKTSNTKCQQTNIKTKHKRLVVQQSRPSQDDDVKIGVEPTSKQSVNKMHQNSNKQKQSKEDSIRTQLLSMGFQQRYIRRALNVYKKNYGTNYNVEVITEIIIRLQTKDDKQKNSNKKNKQISNKNFNSIESNDSKNRQQIIADNVGTGLSPLIQSVAFDDDTDVDMSNFAIENDSDCKVQNKNWKGKPVDEWTSEQLKDWIYSLDMISKDNRDKIIDGVEEFKINAVDFYLSQNGQEIADTFDVETTVGNLVYVQMQNIQSSDNADKVSVEREVNSQEMGDKSMGYEVKKSERKILTTWKDKKVNEWSCDEIQDWIYSLDIISEDDKNKLIFGIEQSNLTGADFLMCQNGDEIADSFDGVSVKIGNLVFDDLITLSNTLMDSDVRKLFYSSLSVTKYRIIEITKVSTEKDNIYEQILREKCQKSGRDIDRASIEKYLWHGSKNVGNINLICKNGFDRSYNKNSVYGAGTYFAKNAKYSVTKGYCGKDKSGLSYILLCKVIVGEYIVGNSKIKQIPRKSDGEEYDSLVNNTSNPTIFVIWRDYHAIPHYLIKYKCCK